MPAVLFFLFFAVVPLGLVLYLSFTKWDGLASPEVIGLGNWSHLFSDPQMRQSAALSLALTAVTWLFQTPVSLLLGVWAAGRQRTRAVLSAIFFIPLVLSSAAIAVLWHALLDPNFGIVKQVGPWLGIGGDPLGSSTGAFFAVVFVTGWQFIPLHALIYQGGARQIPSVLYEAATIDGAGRYRQFFRITLPQLRHTITTSSVIMVVGSLTYFDTVLILTNGGPGTATSIVPYLMYKTGFLAFDLGYASTIAAALVVVATLVGLLLVRVTGFGTMRSTREGL
ncbi:MAG: carbohydrate ABC transporter permease [Micromonosporaceae bacterium]